MASTPVAIGPFTGGLNNYSDPAAVGDEECVQIRNFDIDLDGTLVSRPPIIQDSDLLAAPYHDVIATYTEPNSRVTYLIYVTEETTRAYNTSVKTSQLIRNAPFRSAVMYDDKLWLVSDRDDEDGGYWTPTSSFTAVGDMAKGVSSVIYKERMFIGNSKGRLYFSGPGNLENWSSSDFLDVKSGDGQELVKVMDFSGQIVIFKTESTYIFQYDSAPTRGTVQAVSSSVGLDNSACITEQDGIIYVFHNQTAYSVNNWRWEQINTKVLFNNDLTSFPPGAVRKFSLSVLGYRLVIRYGDVYYIYGLKTRCWTTWTSSHPVDYWIRHPEKDSEGLDVYYAGGYTGDKIFKFVEKYSDGPTENQETIVCSVTSKMYDYSVPYSFKRLFWWGIDIVTKHPVNVQVRPHVHSVGITWDDANNENYTWDQLRLAGGTWDRPLDKSLDVSDNADIYYVSGARVFVRFIKALRFRKVSFYLEGTNNGTSAEGPLRVFSMVSNISNRQQVPKKIN